MTDLSRYDDWLTWLREQAQNDGDIRVVFVGGSAVTGGYDDHSDLDVEVLAAPGEAVAAHQRLLIAALSDFAVHQEWELPEAMLPGPDLAERASAASAWQDELMAQLAG